MATVIDKGTGLPAEVPDEQVADLWKAGHVQLIAGKPYQLQSPSGEYIHATGENVAHALSQGASFASRAAAQAQANEEQYGGLKGALVAGGSGAVSQATLGISDQLLPKSWRDEEQRYQKQNPISTMVGEGVGAAGLAAVTGGAGLGEELGAGAARAVGVTGDSLLGKVAQRAIAGGMRDAVAGAQYGLAKTISDDAISDHKLTAEHILSNIGGNALWGGAIGAGLGGIGGLLHGAIAPTEGDAPALASALARSPTDADVEKIAQSITKAPPADGLGAKARNWYVKLAAAASGKNPDDIAAFMGPDGEANRAALFEADSVRDQAMRDIKTHGDAVMGASKDVQEHLGPRHEAQLHQERARGRGRRCRRESRAVDGRRRHHQVERHARQGRRVRRREADR